MKTEAKSLAGIKHPDAHTASRARAVTIVSVLTAVGMFFGYARDAGLAALFGANGATDAFLVATLVPIMLGRIILSGSLAPAVLPVFSTLLDQRRAAWQVANSILTLAGIFLIAISVLLALAAEPLITWLAPGFDPERVALGARILITTAPAVALFGLSALMGMLLNALAVYDIPALGTVLVNGSSFAAILIAGRVWGVEGAAIGLVVGGVFQIALQAVALRRQGWQYRPALETSHPAVREMIRLFVPLLAFMILDQVVTVTERVIASGFAAGDLSRLSYANKIQQIPFVVLASSVGVVLFPVMSRDNAVGDVQRYIANLRSGMRNVVLLTLPLALWMFFASGTWVRLVFQRGEFTPEDARITADLLRWYSLAVIPTGVLLVLYRAFHALRDMVTPLLLGVPVAVLYVVLAVVLSGRMAVEGLPAAFFLAQSFGVVLLFVVLSAKLDRFGSRALVQGGLLQVCIAGAILGVAVAGWPVLIEPMVGRLSVLAEAAIFGAVFVVSVLAYLALAWKLGVPEAQTYFSIFPLARLKGLMARK